MRTFFTVLWFLYTTLLGVCAETTITNDLRFFVISEAPIAKGRYVNTAEFPKLGYVSNYPALTITRVRSVTPTNATRTIRYQGQVSNQVESAINLRFFPNDAARLRIFTGDNVGGQILLMSGMRALLAARLASPIDSGELQITLGERKDGQGIVTELKKLVPK